MENKSEDEKIIHAIANKLLDVNQTAKIKIVIRSKIAFYAQFMSGKLKSYFISIIEEQEGNEVITFEKTSYLTKKEWQNDASHFLELLTHSIQPNNAKTSGTVDLYKIKEIVNLLLEIEDLQHIHTFTSKIYPKLTIELDLV